MNLKIEQVISAAKDFLRSFIPAGIFQSQKKIPDSALQPLDVQVSSALQNLIHRNLQFGLSFRIVLGMMTLCNITALSFFLELSFINLAALYCISFFYTVINIIARIYSDLSLKSLRVTGYLMPVLEIFLLTMSTFLNPSHDYIFFFGSEKVMFAVIIVLSSLQGNRKQVIVTTACVAVSHFAVSMWLYSPAFLIAYQNLKGAVNPQEFFWYSVYYALLGWILSRKAAETQAMNRDIIDIWIPKIIGGAYQDLRSEDGFMESPFYSVFSTTQYPDNFIGADFFRAEKRGEDVVIVVGDIVSHGLNVSQGAIACLSAFRATTSTDPAEILSAINRVLLSIDREHGGETLAIVLTLSPDGTVLYNGYAEKMTHMQVGKEHKLIKMDDIETSGFLLGKNPDYVPPPNKKLKMGHMDNLVILTDGAANSDPADDKTSVIITYNKIPRQVSQGTSIPS